MAEAPQVVDAACHREEDRDGDRELRQRDEHRIWPLQDQKGDRRHLRRGLGLAHRSGRYDAALGRRHRAQDRDEQLSREDHDDHPRGDQALLDEDYQHGQHEQLVREGIEKLSQVADSAAPASDLAVERVGEGEDDEQGGGELVVAVEPHDEQNHQKRNRRQPAERQCIRNVHRGSYGEVCDVNS